MNFKKTPRTLKDAYGPYCSPYIEDNEVTYWTKTRILFGVTYFVCFFGVWWLL